MEAMTAKKKLIKISRSVLFDCISKLLLTLTVAMRRTTMTSKNK